MLLSFVKNGVIYLNTKEAGFAIGLVKNDGNKKKEPLRAQST